MFKLPVLIVLCASVAGASEPSDPFLRDLALTQRFELGNPTRVQPTPDGKTIFFLRAEPRSPVNSLYRFDVATGETKKLLAPEDVLRGAEEKLSAAERQQRERQRQSGRGFVHFELSHDGKLILAALSGRLFIVRLADNDVSELKIAAQPALNPTLSPDGTQVAFVHDRDLYVYDLHAHKERRLTKATDPAISNGMAEFVAEEELDRVQGFWWSPDSRQLAFEEADARGVEKLTLPDLAHPERATEPALYPRAGKPNVKVRVGLIAATGGTPRWLTWDTQKLPYLAKVVWSDRAPLTLVLLSRDQKTTEAQAFESRGGAGKTLVTESDAQFLELDPTVPRWLPDGSGFLWSSTATGAPRLELHAADGKLVRPLSTSAEYYVGLGAVDGKRRLAWFTGAPSPVESKIYRVSLDGGPPSAISHAPAPAVVRGNFPTTYAGVWVESYRAGDAVPHTIVHVDDDKGDRVAGELPSVAVTPPFALKQQIVRVGANQLWAAIVRPRNFDATKKYPVIVDVYAGPHVNVVRASPSPLPAVDRRSRRHRRRHRRSRHAAARQRLGAPHRRRLLAHARRPSGRLAGFGRAAQRAGPHARRHHRLVVRRLRIGAGGAVAAGRLPRRRRRRAGGGLARLRYGLHRALLGTAHRQRQRLRRQLAAHLRGAARAAAARRPRHRRRQRVLLALAQADGRALSRGTAGAAAAVAGLYPSRGRSGRHRAAQPAHAALPARRAAGAQSARAAASADADRDEVTPTAPPVC